MKNSEIAGWMEVADKAADDITFLLSKLDRREHACSECSTIRSENWKEEQAAKALEGAVGRIRKAQEIIRQ